MKAGLGTALAQVVHLSGVEQVLKLALDLGPLSTPRLGVDKDQERIGVVQRGDLEGSGPTGL